MRGHGVSLLKSQVFKTEGWGNPGEGENSTSGRGARTEWDTGVT